MNARTTCPYCGVGCGVTIIDGMLRGDPAHPANFGRVCSKGAALKDTLALPDRLTKPMPGRYLPGARVPIWTASPVQGTRRARSSIYCATNTGSHRREPVLVSGTAGGCPLEK
jgi:hypothetical protein